MFSGSKKGFKNVSFHKQQKSVIAAVRQIKSGAVPKVSSCKTLR